MTKIDLKKFINITSITCVGNFFCGKCLMVKMSGGKYLHYCRLKQGRSVAAREDAGIDKQILM